MSHARYQTAPTRAAHISKREPGRKPLSARSIPAGKRAAIGVGEAGYAILIGKPCVERVKAARLDRANDPARPAL